MHDLVLHGGHMRSVERPVPARRVHQHRSQGEHVGSRRDAPPQHLFRSPIPRCHGHLAGRRQRQTVFGAGDAEVDDARAVRGQDDVGGLEIAVDQAGGVDAGEGTREGGGQGAYGGFVEGPMGGDGLVEGGTGQELGSDPRPPALGLCPEDARHALVRHRLRRPGLAYEALREVLVVGELGPEHLDRCHPARAVLSGVDLAHTAFADHPEQAVRAEAERVAGAEGIHESGPSAGIG